MNNESVPIAQAKTQKKPSLKKIIGTVLAAVIAYVAIYFFFTDPAVLAHDLARNLTTQTPADVEALISNLHLTNKGKFIFGAVDPRIEDADSFNHACTISETSVSSLGCYDLGTQKIHIYNVESEELAGEVEATAAHELMHAAWERLSNFDRMKLEPLLLSVYNSEEYSEMLHKSTENYAPDALLTELHSQLAERVRNLPPELEAHYTAYFEDQDLIVDYFERYYSVMDELIKKSEVLSAEIETGRTALMQQADDYEKWLDDYNARVDAFNVCARDPDCSLVNFESRRDAFIAEGKQIDAAYEAYESARAELNAKIDVYNSGVEHLKNLDYALDSRAGPEVKVDTKETNK